MEAIKSRKEMVVVIFFWVTLVIVTAMAMVNGVKSLKSRQNPVLAKNAGSNTSVGPMDTEGNVQATQPDEQKLIRYVADNPWDIDSMIRLGDVYYDRNEYAEAIEVFKRAEKVNPENLHVQTDLGMLYMRTNKPDEAIVKFKKVLQIRPGFLNAHFYMGHIYRFDKQDEKKAIFHFEEVLNNNPNANLRKAATQQIEEIRNKHSL